MQITIKNLQKKIPLKAGLIRKAAQAALCAQGMEKLAGSLNICFAANSLVRALNSKYHHSKNTTDVLAFDLRRGPKDAFFADIIISADTAKTNARIFRTGLDQELCLYTVHGILHLGGYTDRSARQRKKMERRTEIICRSIRPKP